MRCHWVYFSETEVGLSTMCSRRKAWMSSWYAARSALSRNCHLTLLLQNMLLLDNFVHSDLHPGNIMVKFYKPSTSYILQGIWSSISGAPRPEDPLLNSEAASDLSDEIVARLRPLRHSRKAWLEEIDKLSEEGFQPELVFLDAGLVTQLDDMNRRNFLELFRAIAEFDVRLSPV